jgi:hypothetical protein
VAAAAASAALSASHNVPQASAAAVRASDTAASASDPVPDASAGFDPVLDSSTALSVGATSAPPMSLASSLAAVNSQAPAPITAVGTSRMRSHP